jgi:23S rRNA pseudouridine2604 synthase
MVLIKNHYICNVRLGQRQRPQQKQRQQKRLFIAIFVICCVVWIHNNNNQDVNTTVNVMVLDSWISLYQWHIVKAYTISTLTFFKRSHEQQHEQQILRFYPYCQGNSHDRRKGNTRTIHNHNNDDDNLNDDDQLQNLDYRNDAVTSNDNSNDVNINTSDMGIRLNKIFTKIYSRRASDKLIIDGRVKVNGHIVYDMGRRVIPYHDRVELDDQLYMDWEQHCNIEIPPSKQDPSGLLSIRNESQSIAFSSNLPSSTWREDLCNNNATISNQHIYIKYWKPVGVISTTDRNIPNNLIDSIYDVTIRRRYDPYHQDVVRNGRRIFNVGRLDKDSSGLILLTSDGRIPNVVLSKRYVHSKVYCVLIDRPITMEHLQQLRGGIVITTDTIRQGKHRSYTSKTLPCTIEPLYNGELIPDTTDLSTDSTPNTATPYVPTTELRITLIEGRNRQIRVMLQTVGQYHVLRLHRINFLSHIDLTNLNQPGDWTFLNRTELNSLQDAMIQSTGAITSATATTTAIGTTN